MAHQRGEERFADEIRFVGHAVEKRGEVSSAFEGDDALFVFFLIH